MGASGGGGGGAPAWPLVDATAAGATDKPAAAAASACIDSGNAGSSSSTLGSTPCAAMTLRTTGMRTPSSSIAKKVPYSGCLPSGVMAAMLGVPSTRTPDAC